ncbi:MAG: hypothetical protein WC700_07755 [Gemmatimonadaceae bacterium]|jgi:hypothetical protein
MSQPILGISGVMGAGKDTLAERICHVFPGYSRRKFGTILREAVTTLTGFAFTGDDAADKAHDLSAVAMTCTRWVVRLSDTIHGVVGKSEGDVSVRMFRVLFPGEHRSFETVALRMTVGRLLQVLGTECFRELVGPDVWVDALFRRWEAEGRPPIVVADVRFPNEVAALVRRGGVVIRVERVAARRDDGRVVAHASEHALDGVPPDVTIANDGAVPDLDLGLMAAWPRILALAAARR